MIFDCWHFGVRMVVVSRGAYTTLCFALLWLKEYCVLGRSGGSQFLRRGGVREAGLG